MRSSVKLLLCVLLGATACRNLERFDTKDEAAYCGDLVSGPAFHDGFVATGAEPPTIRLKLTLDTGQLSSFSENKTALPGTLTSNDGERGLCSGDGQPLFQSAPLRA